MALSSKLFTEESTGKAALKRWSETHAGHFYRGMATNPGIKDAIARIQTALRQVGLTVSDPPGVYGPSTEAAVLNFKGPPRNILGPGQKKPDAIVGIKTIHQLDQEIQGNAPPTPPLSPAGVRRRPMAIHVLWQQGLQRPRRVSTLHKQQGRQKQPEFQHDGPFQRGRSDWRLQRRDPRRVHDAAH
jgi:peptidoglycan hydrolase-like protein with peptidoglycan-binding domain